MSLRSQFAATVTRLMADDPKIVLILGDIGVYSFRDAFSLYPKRCINIGVCEQASVSFAAGLAMAGYYPIFSTIESFLVRRAYEQIYLDFGAQNLKSLFVGIGGAEEYKKLGPTHCCPEGAEMMRRVPGMSRYYPNTDQQAEDFLTRAITNRVLAFIRLEQLMLASPPQTEEIHVNA